MADTLEEVRKHVEDLIRRLSEAEAHAEPEPAAVKQAPMNRAALADLETNVTTLSIKVDQAGNLLAQVTDLLESQAERLETLELQVGEGDAGWPAEETAAIDEAPPRYEPVERAVAAGPAALATPAQQAVQVEAGVSRSELAAALADSLHAVREDIAMLGAELRGRAHDLDVRVHDVDSRLLDLSARFEDMRELAWQQRSEIRTLEERFMTLSEPQSLAPTGAVSEPMQRLPIVAAQPAQSQPAFESPRVVVAPAPISTESGFDGQVATSPTAARVVTVSSSLRDASAAAEEGQPPAAAALEPMDARTVRRLEELVEREVRLQQEFTPGAPVRTGRRTRPSVMVVDDLPDARKILSIYLSRTGYQVVTASGAEDCLAKLRHHDVDAVILDASMPGGGGAQVCRSLREDEMFAAKRHIPVIVYTGYPDDYPPSVVDAWGATDYVVKGGDMLPLITALVRHTKEQPEALP